MIKNKQSLLRLTKLAYDTPHLITTDSLDKLLTYLDTRNLGELMKLDGEQEDDSEEEDGGEILDDFVAYIKVDGAITYKPVMGMCGEVRGCSYKGLLESVEDAIEEGAQCIVMDFSTPGGQATHAFEFAEEIRKLCTDNGVEMIAYVDEMACSAGYLLACICDEVIANPDAVVGSIGAVVALTDVSEAMKQAGIKRIFITSGTAKVPYDEDGAFKSDFIEKVQSEVDMLNTKFTNHVSKYTGLPTETISALNADSFNAEEALSIGLINSIQTQSEFAAYLAAKCNKKKLGASNA